MRRDKLTEFLANNKDAFELLAEEIRDAQDLSKITTLVELEGNKRAVKIVKNWIDKIFIEVESDDIVDLIEEESIFKMNKTPEKEF